MTNKEAVKALNTMLNEMISITGTIEESHCNLEVAKDDFCYQLDALQDLIEDLRDEDLD